jgi:hypothetical protein
MRSATPTSDAAAAAAVLVDRAEAELRDATLAPAATATLRAALRILGARCRAAGAQVARSCCADAGRVRSRLALFPDDLTRDHDRPRSRVVLELRVVHLEADRGRRTFGVEEPIGLTAPVADVVKAALMVEPIDEAVLWNPGQWEGGAGAVIAREVLVVETHAFRRAPAIASTSRRCLAVPATHINVVLKSRDPVLLTGQNDVVPERTDLVDGITRQPVRADDEPRQLRVRGRRRRTCSPWTLGRRRCGVRRGRRTGGSPEQQHRGCETNQAVQGRAQEADRSTGQFWLRASVARTEQAHARLGSLRSMPCTSSRREWVSLSGGKPDVRQTELTQQMHAVKRAPSSLQRFLRSLRSSQWETTNAPCTHGESSPTSEHMRPSAPRRRSRTSRRRAGVRVRVLRL